MKPICIVFFTAIMLIQQLKAQTPYAVLNPGQTDYNSKFGVYPDHEGNFYLVNKSYYPQDLDAGAGVLTYGPPNQQVLIAKYTSSFELLWSAHIEQATILESKAAFVADDNSLLIAGTTSTDFTIYTATGTSTVSTPSGQPMWLAKFDSDGGLLNAIAIGGPSGSSAPYPVSTSVDNSGNATITGYYTGNVDFDPGVGATTLSGSLSDAYGFIAKYSATGNLLWAKKIGNGSNTCSVLDHAVDNAGNIILGGWFTQTVDFDLDPFVTHALTAVGSGDAFFAKYDADGNYIWAGQLVENLFYGGVNEIETDAGNNIYVSGFMDKPCDFDIGPAVKTRKPHGTGFYVAKYTSSGALKWIRQPSGNGDFLLNEMYVDPAGNVFTSGTFSGTFDFDFSTGTYNLSGPDVDLLITDQWLSCMDKSGNFNYAFSLHTDPTVISGISSIYSVCVTTDNKLIIAGKYLKTLDIDPGVPVWEISVPGVTEAGFVIGYDQPVFRVGDIETSTTLQVYPNPADREITLVLGDIAYADISIIDMQGKLIYHTGYNSDEEASIDVSAIPEGIYILRAKTNDQIKSSTICIAH